jgi:hypothetical protein
MWSPAHLLYGEVVSLQLELMPPIFHAYLGVRILAVQIEEFRDDIIKFDIFEMSEFDDVTLLTFHRSGNFSVFHDLRRHLVAVSSRGNPKFARNPLTSCGS